MTFSHQSVVNLLKIESKRELVFDVEELSEYYRYDEQFIEIGDKSLPKAQLIDIMSNQTSC